MPIHELSKDVNRLAQRFAVTRCRGGRRGGGYVITVISLPVLLGIAALAIDLALLSLSAQRVQNVVDATALAGAIKASNATASGLAVAETTSANNDNSAWQVETAVTCYGPGEDVPGFRTLGYRERVVEVQGATNFEFCFARIFGLDRAMVSRDAAAMCEVWRNRLAEGFIFAGSTDPGVWGVYSDGKQNHFNGDIHSNTGVCLNGLDNSVNGDIKYRNAFEQNGNGFLQNGAVVETSIEPYPVDFTFADFTQDPFDYVVPHIYETSAGASLPSGRYHVQGDMTINASNFHCKDSLVVVEGNIRLSGSGSVYENCTLIARGSVSFTFADGSFSPLVHDLFAFTEMESSSDVMVVDGARTRASGVLYAPNGGLHFEGSPMYNYHIGLVADTVNLIGSGMTHDGPASALTCDETSEPRLVR